MRLRIVWLFIVGVALIAACGTGDGGETTATAEEPTSTTAEAEDTTTTTTTEGEDSTTTTTEREDTTTTTATADSDGVHASESAHGEILVDADGFALYIFTEDSGGESTCYDACAELWPPASAETAISSELDAALFGTVVRADGSEQLAVRDQPLYLYTPDVNPGDATGQGVGGVWFVVDADGNAIGAASEASGDSLVGGEAGDESSSEEGGGDEDDEEGGSYDY